MGDLSRLNWRIHLGAHKTGTTHVQDLLAQRRDTLAVAGIDYAPRALLREARLASCVRPASGNLRDLGPIRRLRQRWMLRRIRRMRDARTLVLSEEDILGLSDGLLADTLYPEAAERVANLRDLTGGQPTSLFLSIRNPARYLPSAYAQCLRAGARSLAPFEQLLERALRREMPWTGLVGRIRGAFPEASLTVWSLEDYTLGPGAYLDLLVGQPTGGWPELAPPASTLGLSADTIRRILAIETGLSRKDYRERCAALAAGDTGNPPYRPIGDGDIATLTRGYEADLATMERAFPGVLRRLPTAG